MTKKLHDRWALLAFALLVLVVGVSGCSLVQSKIMIVRFLDVGQADSCFITMPSGETMLIDAGTRSAGSAVVKSMTDAGVKKIDYLVLTHPHEDHIGGAVSVIKAFDIGKVFMPRTSHTTATYENLLLAIEDKGSTVFEAKAGKVVIDSEDLKASFVGPTKSYDELNDWSAVLVLTYGTQSFLFPGDASNTAEKDMLDAKTIPDVDVLKVGHHGSATSTSSGFLKATSPSVAVISAGADNDYGYPAKSLLDRLTAQKVSIYRTDIHGTVTVTSDGKGVKVTTEKPGKK